MYYLNSSNNTLSFSYNGVDTSLNFPMGNYNVNTLLTIFATAPIITVTYDQRRGCLFITSNNFIPLIFYGTSTIKSVLGFTDDINVTNGVFLPYPVNLLGITQIKICSSKIISENEDYGGNTNLLNVIYVNQKQNSIQNYKFTDIKKYYKK